MAAPVTIKTADNKFTVDTHYQARLARGTHGDVYLGKDENKKEVAVKLHSGDAELIQKLASVAEPLQELDHRNVVKMLGVEKEPRELWIVMEYCSGGTLTKYLEEKKLKMNDKIKIMADVTEGLEYLHSKDVVHRDIKPDNILMSGDVPKIADFDYCKVLPKGAETIRSTGMGTDAFRAPEFFMKDTTKYHRNIDIFSLGLTILGVMQFDAVSKSIIVPRIESLDSQVVMSIGLTIANKNEKHVVGKKTDIKTIALIIVGCVVGSVVVGISAGALYYIFLGKTAVAVTSGVSASAAVKAGATAATVKAAATVKGAATVKAATTVPTAAASIGKSVVVGVGAGAICLAPEKKVTQYYLKEGYFREFIDGPFNERDKDDSSSAKAKRAALRKLIQSMAAVKPEDRPFAAEVLGKLKKIRQM